MAVSRLTADSHNHVAWRDLAGLRVLSFLNTRQPAWCRLLSTYFIQYLHILHTVVVCSSTVGGVCVLILIKYKKN